ncbi:hypothetical protein OS493_007442 [Desmophyllum pertusum]|uniref:PLAT domain-containing protein n=1 Tax=Desmophyllum pertusum TaxID=174260 RepID=A0A9X0CU68_9CNID|nr:hypothetical protein OS493_007442 [Desmophyllum pertusum]
MIFASESASYRYELCIKTGVWPGSFTTANTSFIIYGVEGNSGRIQIPQDISTGSKHIFARGTEEKFTFVLDQDLGDIKALRVCHDNSGNDPSWFLEDITITTPSSEGSCTFLFGMWLNLKKESSCNELLRNPSRSAPNITTIALKELFLDGHLWLSVLTKAPGNCFTRVQRITSCLCLLFSAMAANAAFYYLGTKHFQTISIGPMKFSARQAIAGIQSSLLILPVHIIILLFKKSSARLQERLWRWLLYITWGLCCAIIATSAGVTISYSLMWGSDKSQEWVSSVAVSFLQDILMVQPFKCLLLASLTVMFSRCKGKKVGFPFRQHDGVIPDKKVTNISMKPTELSKLRKESDSRARRRSMIAQTCFYLAFYVVVGVLAYGNRDSSRYLLSKSFDYQMQRFEKVQSPRSFWNWLNESLIPYVYSSHYQKTSQQSDELRSTLIGMPRLRQLRSRKVPCPGYISTWWQQSCYDSYSQDKEFREPFQPNQVTSPFQFKQCPLPWLYRTAEELNSSSKWGQHAWYGGGGYSADLGYDEKTARSIASLLQSENWIDRQTRAVIVEFSVFNPTSNILAVCSFFFEQLQTGQANVFKRIDTISLYNTDSILQVFRGLCVVIFIVMVFIKFGENLVTAVRQRRHYFCSTWNWVELGHVISSILVLVFSFLKSYHTSMSVRNIQQNIFATINFQTSVLWVDVENSSLAVLTFLTTVKLLHLTYYNMYTRVFARSLRIWMRNLPSFMFVLAIIFLAFLLTGISIFGSSIGRYSSFWSAFSFQFEIVLGKVKERPIKELTDVNVAVGHIFVTALLVSITIMLMNFFISTLNDAVNEAKTLELEQETDQQTFEDKSLGCTSGVNDSNDEIVTAKTGENKSLGCTSGVNDNNEEIATASDNQEKKHDITGEQGEAKPKLKSCLVNKSFPESKIYTLLDKKLAEVLESIDAVFDDGINTSDPSKKLKNREKRVRINEVAIEIPCDDK